MGSSFEPYYHQCWVILPNTIQTQNLHYTQTQLSSKKRGTSAGNTKFCSSCDEKNKSQLLTCKCII